MEASAQSTVETLCPDYDEVRSSLSCSDGPAEKRGRLETRHSAMCADEGVSEF